jgi:4-hydroxy-2-oxoheptanedioate aldolase
MNGFKEALAAGHPQIGLWQALASPYCAEVSAGAGFDWLLLDGEHAPNELPTILAQLQAIARYPVEPVVRLPTGDPVLIKRYLDIGARSLLIPMVESGDQAAALVAACRYPPQGIRGVGSALGRASLWNRVPNYLHDAERDICLLLQVESIGGIANLDAILGVEGVDGMFIGPSDLAAALGHLGNPGHAEVQEVIKQALRRIVGAGKAAGIIAADETAARRYLALGATFVAVGTDVTILARGAEALAARFRGDGPVPGGDTGDRSY